ncbi:hypothetical protein G4G31_21405 [Massilia sp. Se16.2.3]|nr:hypothetical protein G4G31_21405 [Massilia sp. Se16.2.3]
MPSSTVDAVTGAPLNSRFDLESMGLGQDATALPASLDANAEAGDSLLDFDLGGLSFEPVAATDSAAVLHTDATAVPDLQFEMEPFAPLEPASGTPVVDPAAGSLDDLAFDMNFDAPASAPAAAQDTAAADDGFVLDLSKDAQQGGVDTNAASTGFDLASDTATPAAIDNKDALFDLDAMDFGLADTTPVTPVGQAEEPVFDFGSTDLELTAPAHEAPLADAPAAAGKDAMFDLDNLDFGQPAAPAAPQDEPFALDEVPAIPNPGTPVPRFDMSGLDLELPSGDSEITAQPLPDAGTDSIAAESSERAELTPAQMEMETKLDLAIAYQEIGDKEGARELLDEVIKGGNVEQSSRASAMRAQLA